MSVVLAPSIDPHHSVLVVTVSGPSKLKRTRLAETAVAPLPMKFKVGLQVPPREDAALRRFLATLGYRHWDESANPAYRLFLSGR